MTIDEVIKTITEVDGKISNIKEMIADYNVCKNDTSKTYLLTAIVKMTKGLTPNQSTIRSVPES